MIDLEIGNTPLVEFSKISAELGLCSKIFAKLESFNNWGSTKDRVAYQMIKDAFDSKLISQDSTVIEPTSGNTGIALAAICHLIGIKCIIVMPDNMSKQRVDLISKYAADIILTPGVFGMKGSIDKALDLNKQINNSWIAGQFENPSNWKAHYNTTGPEIWSQTNGNIDAFVSGVGTGGTITGVGKFLKENNPNIKIIAVEPENSAVLSGEPAGEHKIQGIGAGFIPQVLDLNIIDEIVQVSDEDSLKYFEWINNTQDYSAGISSGAVLSAAIKIAKSELDFKSIVILCADGVDRYQL